MPVSQQERAAYDVRLARVVEALETRPYGTKAALGFDIRVNAPAVSAVLSGKYYAPTILERIEGWLTDPERARQDALNRTEDHGVVELEA
jgi:hypothetical protein